MRQGGGKVAARWRQGAAAGCARQCPYGGRAGCRYRQALVGRQSHLRGVQIRSHRRLRGAQQARSAPERRQGAAAGCARQCPSGGRAGCRYRQALVGRQSLLRGAQIRPHRYLRGAQQARAARCRCRMRTPMPLRGACGQPVQAKHRAGGKAIYAAHK